MRFATAAVAAITALAAAAYAAPTEAVEERTPGFHWGPNRPRRWGQHKGCMSDADAQDMANIFQTLIQEYSAEVALESLTEDFVDYASSVNILMNRGADAPKSLTAPTFDGRQAFMDGQGSQPQIPFEQLNLFHGCNAVSLRWMTTDSAAGQATKAASYPVIGNVIMDTVPAEKGNRYNRRIKTIYSEFNSAAWIVNLGLFDPLATSTANSTSAKRALENGYRGAMI